MAEISHRVNPLFLRDEELRQGMELMLFAYRDVMAAADRTLADHGLGRAHLRAVYFIGRHPGLSVSELLRMLGITKQSLSRVLKELSEAGFVDIVEAPADRRRRQLTLSDAGQNAGKGVDRRPAPPLRPCLSRGRGPGGGGISPGAAGADRRGAAQSDRRDRGTVSAVAQKSASLRSRAETADCGVCGAVRAKPFAVKDDYDFVRCGECGFVYLDPMPSDAELAALYNADGSAAGYDAKRRSRSRRAHMKLPRFFPYVWRKDALDLGCGGGLTVAALGRIARRAAGLDIAREAVAAARADFPRHDFIAADFRDADVEDAAFDFVHASEIIEHVNDLDAFMGFVARVVRADGHVYITTPDIGHPKVPADVRDWDVFAPPRHVQFFDEGTLSRLFERYGFTARRRYRDAKPGLQMMFRKTLPESARR